MKKRCLAALLILVFSFSLIACNKGGNDAPQNKNSNSGSAGSNISSDSGSSYNNTDSGNYSDSGNSSADNNYPGDSSYSGDGSYSDAGGNASPSGNAPLSLTMYKVNDNFITIVIEDKSSSDTLRSMNVTQLYIRANNDKVGINISGSYASYGFYADDSYSDWRSGDIFDNVMICPNSAMMTIKGNGVAAGLSEGMDFSVEMYSNGSNSNCTPYGSGKVGAVQTVSENDISKIYAEIACKYAPAEKAHDTWNGQYIFCRTNYDNGNYNYEYGTSDIEVTDSGAIVLTLVKGADTMTFVFRESKYDEANYAYGTVIEAEAELPFKPDWHTDATLRLGSDYYNSNLIVPRLNYSYYDDQGSYHSDDYEFTPLTLSSKTAPADFRDEDKYGTISAILKDNGHFLHPSGSNYTITVDEGSDYIYDYSTEKSTEYPCTAITMCEYDINNYRTAYKVLTTFNSTADAAAIYNYRKEWYQSDTSTYELMGSTIQYTSSYGLYRKEADNYSYNGFLKYNGMHYAYPDPNYSGDQHDYMYSSVPFDATKNTPGLELISVMASILSGEHRSIDSQSATMYTSFSASTYYGIRTDFTVYDYDNYSETARNEYARYEGTNAYILSYYSDSWNKEYAVFVDVIEFGPEQSVSTRYQYNLDSLDNVTITLDNFRDFTPAKTITHTFDMTRVITY